MKTLGQNFTTYKNKKYSTPVTLLVFHFATGDVYVSDRDLQAGTGSPEFRGLVRSWGRMSRTAKGLFSVGLSEMTVEVANTGDTPFSSILEGAVPEGVEVEVFQWFNGLSYAEKEAIGRFVIASPVSYSEDSVKLTLVSSFMNRNRMVGRTIGMTEYPYADTDAYGGTEAIVYGSVKNLLCPAVVAGGYSTLVADLTASATSIEISGNVNEAAFPSVPYTAQVGNEQVRVTSKGASPYRSWTVTRGYSGTTAASHKKGASVFEVRSDYTFLAAGHPVKSIGDVYVRGVRVVSGITRQTSSGGKAKLVLSSKFALEKSVSLALSDPTHPHGFAKTVEQFNSQSLPSVTTPCQSSAAYSSGTIYFPTTDGKHTPVNVNYEVGFSPALAVAGCQSYAPNDIQMTIGGVVVYATGSYGSVNLPSPVQFSTSSTADAVSVSVRHNGVSGGTCSLRLSITSAKRTMDVDDSTVAAVTGVSLSGNSAADLVVGGDVTCDMEGYQDDAYGTYTGTPNALIENPSDVIRHFMVTSMGMPASEVDNSSFGSARTGMSQAVVGGFKFAGVVNRPADAIDTIEGWLMQSRLILSHDGYKAKLKMPGNVSVATSKVVYASMIKKSGLSLVRTGREEVVNRMDVLYKRDFSKNGDSVTGYMAVADSSPSYPKDGDAASVAAYGPLGPRRPFLAGFIADPSAAGYLREFYITRFKDAGRRVLLTLFLDNFELECGDVIEVDCPSGALDLQGAKFFIESSAFAPGSFARGRMDEILVQAREV